MLTFDQSQNTSPVPPRSYPLAKALLRRRITLQDLPNDLITMTRLRTL